MKSKLAKGLLILLATALLAACGGPKPTPKPDQTAPRLDGGQGSGLVPGSEFGEFGDMPTDRTGLFDPAGQAALNDPRNLMVSVYFDFDKSALKPAERAKLQSVLARLGQEPNLRVMLRGHCDWRGTAEYNLGLGERRANSVRSYLSQEGVSASRLEVLSRGDLDAVENGTADQMARDRRVDVIQLQ